MTEADVRAILSKHFGGGYWPGKYRAKFTPCAREILAAWNTRNGDHDDR
jgi:hypothetical protein